MDRLIRNLFVGVLLGTASAGAAAGGLAETIILHTLAADQPWTGFFHGHESVVSNCLGAPVNFANIALDDWTAAVNSPIVRVVWWGTSPQADQEPNQPFMIRVYNSDGNCRPTSSIYNACVTAGAYPVGVDCGGRQVYKFGANLPTPFNQVAGTHYWLQISEIDDGIGGGGAPSPTPDAVDFKWSANSATEGCPALRRSLGGPYVPVFDVCDEFLDQNDLAFQLFRSGISVTLPIDVVFPDIFPPRHYIAEFRNLAGQVAETVCFTADNLGKAFLDPVLGPGQYRVGIRGMSRLPTFFDITIPAGGPNGVLDYSIDLGNVAGPLGDVDGDGDVDFADITGVLTNWRP